jgi:tripartite ATP-independent transporter DctM subunit
MEWVPLAGMLAGLLLFFIFGVPVAFGFGVINVLAIFIFLDGRYLPLLVSTTSQSLMNFLYVAFPLFILMGTIFFESGIAEELVRIVGGWLRRVPGQLAVVSMASNALFGALSGSSMAACAAIGSALIPAMEKHGYPARISTGVIAFGGIMSTLIPPSALMVIYGGLAHVSIAKLLIGGITPGLILTLLAIILIVAWARQKPQLFGADKNAGPPTAFRKLAIDTLVLGMPMGFIVFAVVGSIYMGLATPSEASAVGVIASILALAAYRRITLKKLKAAVLNATSTTAMVFFIMVGSSAFSSILFLTGASQHVVALVANINIPPLLITATMLVTVLILGMFIDVISVMFITIPIFTPLLESLGSDPLWFGLLYMYCVALGAVTPPFGVNLFVTKGIAPPGVTLEQIYRGVIPYCLLALIPLPLFLFIPGVLTWLPNMML